MNTHSFAQLTPMYSIKNVGLRESEKEEIMNKVYGSDVFKEFIRQWGDAMPPLENSTNQNPIK